jgi:hypothetical protein
LFSVIAMIRTALTMAAVATSVMLFLALAPASVSAHREGDEGCTPGYWKNHIDTWEGGVDIRVAGIDKTIYPSSLVSDVFDVTFVGKYASYNSMTLEEALNLGGGGVNALLRHGVAALLNSGEIGGDLLVDYAFDDGQVYHRVRAGLDPQAVQDIADISNVDDVEKKKNELAAANENVGGCPLN